MQLFYKKNNKKYTLEELAEKYRSIWIDVFNDEYKFFGGNSCLDDVIIEASEAFEECCLWEEGYEFVETLFNVPTNYNSLFKGIWGYPVKEEV